MRKKDRRLLMAFAGGMVILLGGMYAGEKAYGAYEFSPIPAGSGMNFAPYCLTFHLTPPLENWEKTDGFGWRYHPITGKLDFHYGVDLAVPMKSPIFAAADGTVQIAGVHESYGNYLLIEHSERLATLYAHCEEVLVEAGDSVHAGDTIALSGMSGEATGPHLHFELIADGERRAPELALGES